MKKILLSIGAALVAFGFYLLGRPASNLKKVQKKHDDLIIDGSARAELKAIAAGEKADKLQKQAQAAAEITKSVVDNVGTKDETVRDLLDSWRKPDGV